MTLLKNKIAWVTGATGTIGDAIARRFVQEGAIVHCRRVDITNYVDVMNMAENVQPDILVNCAGVYQQPTKIDDGLALEWTRIISVNLIGSYYLTRAVVPFMRKAGGGKIIHMSGGGAANGRAFYSAYSASKAGLVRMVECVATEVIGDNIQINAIAPGSVKSKMNPGGTGTPDGAVELAVFLASKNSNYLTGRLISAVYDDWSEIPSQEAGMLRRIPFTE